MPGWALVTMQWCTTKLGSVAKLWQRLDRDSARTQNTRMIQRSLGLVVASVFFGATAWAAPAPCDGDKHDGDDGESYLCDGDKHDGKDDSFRLCDGDKHGDGDESYLCDGDKHDDGKDDSFRLCDGDKHDGDDGES